MKEIRAGTIVDATLIRAPGSTKNASQQRDPERHPTKRGNPRYFNGRSVFGGYVIPRGCWPVVLSSGEMRGITPGSERGEGRLLVWEEVSVLSDADHGEDLLEVSREAEGVDFLARVGSFDHDLDDEGDAAGVDVVDFGEVEEDDVDLVFGKGLVGADDGVAGGAGDVAFETDDGNRMAGGRGELVDAGTGFGLHCVFSLAVKAVNPDCRIAGRWRNQCLWRRMTRRT